MLTPKDLAEKLGVNRRQVIRWIKAGKINAIQPGGKKGKYFIPEEEFNRIMGQAPIDKKEEA